MGKDNFKNWNIQVNFAIINCKALALVGGITVVSCISNPSASTQAGASAGVEAKDILRKQEAAAKEIVFVLHTFNTAISQLNNSNAVELAALIKTLSSRIRSVSKELDSLGPFPEHLREVTLKRIESDEISIFKRKKANTLLNPIEPKEDSVITAAYEEFSSIRLAVVMKSGLFCKPETEVNTTKKATRKP